MEHVVIVTLTHQVIEHLVKAMLRRHEIKHQVISQKKFC